MADFYNLVRVALCLVCLLYDVRVSHAMNHAGSDYSPRVSESEATSIDRNQKRLDVLLYRQLTLREKLDDKMTAMKKQSDNIRWMTNTMLDHDMDGQWKSTKKFKCSNSVDFIFPFSVCDGVVDCVGGNDEDNSTTCVSPIDEGSRWVGYPVYNRCNQDICQHMEITILKARRPKWFSAYVQIKAQIDIFRIVEDESVRVESVIIVGAYSFGTRTLFMHTWKSRNRIVLLAEFDGVSRDRCIGYQVRETTMKTCAEYRFFRKTENISKKARE